MNTRMLCLMALIFLLAANDRIVAEENRAPVFADYWVPAGNMLQVRQGHPTTLLLNGTVLIFGWDTNTAEVYDPASDSFIQTGSTVHNHRQGATATLLNDGKVLIAGGLNALQIAELYDPATGTFQLTGDLKHVHGYHTATLLTDGRVLIAGGQDQVGPETHAICEIYDPLSGTFSLTGNLKVGRSSHTATLLPNGQVLIAGGLQTTSPGIGNFLNACEVYDPASGTFSRISDLDQPRVGHAATLLDNGQVLISCGAWYQRFGELFDPATGRWSKTGEMTQMRRNYHTATRLHNGQVLLVGGKIDAVTSSAELYDPLNNTFSMVDSMYTARMEHAATCLADGSVLVTGGYSLGNILKSAERYLVDTTRVVRVDEKTSPSRPTPATFRLLQNYPNPFNPCTIIQFQLPVAARVEVSIFNLLGKQIRVLADQSFAAGTQTITWDGLDDAGQSIAGGVYFCTLRTNQYQATKKLFFLK